MISNDQKIIIFSNTKLNCDDTAKILRKDGFKIAVIHGDLNQF